jgi:hypothetical protein
VPLMPVRPEVGCTSDSTTMSSLPCLINYLLFVLLSCHILFPVLSCRVLYCTVLYYSILFFPVLPPCPALYCTVLYCTVLYCPFLACHALLNAAHSPIPHVMTLSPNHDIMPHRCSSYNKRLAKKGALKVRTDAYILHILPTFVSYFLLLHLISSNFFFF